MAVTARRPKPKQKTAIIRGTVVEIRFPFSWETLAIVKSIPGRRFRTDDGKYWTCPYTSKALEILTKAGFIIEGNRPVPSASTPRRDISRIKRHLQSLKKTLYPFQEESVAFIEARNGRALLGDEMGLGKTIQALAWLWLHPEKRPAVVVCPAHLKLNWAREARELFPNPESIQVLSGGEAGQSLHGKVIVINYDILHRGWIERLLEINPQVLVVDEAHYCKSSKALRTKATKKLARRIPHVIALTGTPIVSRPIEGFNIVRMVEPKLFTSFWNFAHRYCNAKLTPFGWDLSGASNEAELNEILSTIMIRRRKQDVLRELPDKTYSYVPIEIGNRTEYQEAEESFISYVWKTKGPSAAMKARSAEYLTRIEMLKQLAAAGKMPQAIDWIKAFLESNGKLVVFAVHKAAIEAIYKAFESVAVRVDGSTPTAAREEAVIRFQNDDRVRLFVGNIQAAGTGITLTAASSVAFVELPWTSGELSQAEDRCHRIGQKSAVNVYYLLANDTIEERIAQLLDKKRTILSRILDGEEVDEDALLMELIRSYEPKGGSDD